MVLYHRLNIHSPALVKALKGSFVKGLKDYKKLHDYGASQIVCGFATNDLIKYNPEFQHLNLSRTNLILMLFPKKIFQSVRSPQYIPYSAVAKILTEGYQHFSLNHLVLSIFGLSSVKYYNKDLFALLFPYIESKLSVSFFFFLSRHKIFRTLTELTFLV